MRKRNCAVSVLRTVLLVCGLFAIGSGCFKGKPKQEPPYYKWLNIGFKFDGRKMRNCGLNRVYTEARNTSIVKEGRFDKACRFDGEATFTIYDIRFPDEGTWCLWFRLPADLGPHLEMRIADANQYRMAIRRGKLNVQFHDGEWRRFQKVFVPTPGQWTHAALTWAGDELKLYVNGKRLGVLPFSGKPDVVSCTMVVGARWTQKEEWFTGDVDELLIFERCLAPEEILELYANGVDKAEPPVLIGSTEKVIMTAPTTAEEENIPLLEEPESGQETTNLPVLPAADTEPEGTAVTSAPPAKEVREVATNASARPETEPKAVAANDIAEAAETPAAEVSEQDSGAEAPWGDNLPPPKVIPYQKAGGLKEAPKVKAPLTSGQVEAPETDSSSQGGRSRAAPEAEASKEAEAPEARE